MSTIDILRSYIKDEWRAGRLHSGDRLPSYHDLAKVCKASYVTVHGAMSKLEWEGLVRIENGNGSFLALDDTLPVLLRFPYEMLSPVAMADLLEQHLRGTGLKFKFEYSSIFAPRPERSDIAVLEIGKSENSFLSADFSNMPEYKTVTESMDSEKKLYSGMPMPFVFTTYQMGANTSYFEKAGIPVPKMTGRFVWWDAYVAGCRKAGLVPASTIWNNNTVIAFRYFCGVAAALSEPSLETLSSGDKWFTTPPGQKLFRMLSDVQFFNDDVVYFPENFYTGAAGIDFHIGSWISVQNLSPRRPDIRIKNLALVPFSIGKRRLLPVTRMNLHTLLPEKFPEENRSRIWELLRVILSRKFRLSFCNATGHISAGNDISPDEYQWYTPQLSGFFPKKDDLPMDEEKLFPEKVIPALTMAVGLWKFAGADLEKTCQQMDWKINRKLPNTQFYQK